MHIHSGLFPSKKAISTLQTVGIIVVIVVALIAGSVYYYVGNPFRTGTESTPSPTETPLITPTPTSTASPTPTSSPPTPKPTSHQTSSTTSPTDSPSTPTPTPDVTVTSSPTPAPPTATPTPVPTIPPITWKLVDLAQAVLENLVEATVSGDGLTEIDLTLQLTSNESLEVTIKAGTMFQAQSASVQSMVVIENKTIHLESPGDNVSVILDVACAAMELDQPKSTDVFTISSGSLPADLVLLLNCSAFGGETFRVKQFAIWTITDNPARDGYVGLGTGLIGSGPSDAEMTRIRALFVVAGIVPEKYKALQ